MPFTGTTLAQNRANRGGFSGGRRVRSAGRRRKHQPLPEEADERRSVLVVGDPPAEHEGPRA
jgi:hypothetical protein